MLQGLIAKVKDSPDLDVSSEFQRIRPLLANAELQQDILDFIAACLDYHYDKCDLLRPLFLSDISTMDNPNVVHVLTLLTKNGRDIRNLEHAVAPVLLRLLNLANNSNASPLIAFATNMIKFAFLNFDRAHIIRIFEHVIEFVNVDPLECLRFIDALMRYGRIPDSCIPTCIEKLSQIPLKMAISNWSDIKLLFNSYSSERALNSLFKIMSIKSQNVNCAIIFYFNIAQESAEFLSSLVSLRSLSLALQFADDERKQLGLESLKLVISKSKMESFEWDIVIDALHAVIRQKDVLTDIETALTIMIKNSFSSQSISAQATFLLSIIPVSKSLDFSFAKLIIDNSISLFTLDERMSCCDALDFLVSSFYLDTTRPLEHRLYLLCSLSIVPMGVNINSSEYQSMLKSLTNSLLLEPNAECFEKTLIWIIDNVPRFDSCHDIVDIFLQCILGIKGQLMRFWDESVANNKRVKLVGNPVIYGYQELSIPSVHRTIAASSLCKLFLALSNLKFAIDWQSAVFKAIARVSCWIDVVSSESRGICCSFLAHLKSASYRGNSQYHIVNPSNLPISEYLYAIITIILYETNETLLADALENVPLQLHDQDLWVNQSTPLNLLRKYVCGRIMLSSQGKGVQKKTTRETSLADGYFQILFALISYRSLFSKKRQDEFLIVFQFGLENWFTMGKCGIRGLNLSLYELPNSVIKYLPAIITKISQITAPSLAMPGLLLLSSLARLPNLYVNFTAKDYKRIFGIALQHLRSFPANEQQISNQFISQMGYHVVAAWFLAIKIKERHKYVPFILQHLTGASSESDVSNIDSALPDPVELVLDLMLQNTFTDCWPKPVNFEEIKAQAGFKETRLWIQGNSIISISAPNFDGMFQVVLRRPTGILSFKLQLENPLKGYISNRHLVHIAEDGNWNPISTKTEFSLDSLDKSGTSWTFESIPEGYARSSVDSLTSPKKHSRSRTVSGDMEFKSHETAPVQRIRSFQDVRLSREQELQPKQLFRQMFQDPRFAYLQFMPYPNVMRSMLNEMPVILPFDGSVERAVSVLDMTPVVDVHKIGIIYVAENQTSEMDILGNTLASSLYLEFLSTMGQYFSLLDSKHIYSGGLDTSEELLDGPYGLLYLNDMRLEQIIYHVTTLMPTRKEDPHCTGKKRHIGNDYVNIIWNYSDLDFNPNTIPGQFNFALIIIEPLTGYANSIDFPNETCHNYAKTLFRIKLHLKEGLPDPKPSFDSRKVIMGQSLAPLVRQLALHLNMYCLVVAAGGMYKSNAQERLLQIKKVKERFANSKREPGNTLDFTQFL